MAGLYIHIPFCASRCIYCGFYSTTLLSLQDRYVDALCREMELRRSDFSEPVETIYLGGGTPSQLSPANLQRLFHYIYKVYGLSPLTRHTSHVTRHTSSVNCKPSTVNGHMSPLKEVTIECNPDDLSAEYVAVLSQLPINRISMGAQTFSDDRLRFLHRRHTAADIRTAVNRLRSAGFRNISIDLMFGFPDETLADWQRDIDEALALNVEHISAYSLMYEEGTVLFEQYKNTKNQKLNEETERQMYETLIDRLEAAGYEHYEISNFAKASPMGGGWRGLHNSNYWNGTPYIGIGAAAHSYLEELRSESKEPSGSFYRCWNVSDIRTYINAIERGKLPFERELLDEDTRYNDLITTALRTREGIFLTTLAPKYHSYLMQNAQTALRNGLLRIDNDRIHLTRQGLFVSDDVMSDLIYV